MSGSLTQTLTNIFNPRHFTINENILGDITVSDDEDNYILLMYISSQDRLLVCNDKDNSHYTNLLTLVLEEVGIESGITLEELFEYSKSLIFETKELILNK